MTKKKAITFLLLQKYGEDFAKLCGLLRIYELYQTLRASDLYTVESWMAGYYDLFVYCSILVFPSFFASVNDYSLHHLPILHWAKIIYIFTYILLFLFVNNRNLLMHIPIWFDALHIIKLLRLRDHSCTTLSHFYAFSTPFPFLFVKIILSKNVHLNS